MTDYYIIITDAGAALEVAAHAAGEPLVLTAFGVCDGGEAFTPDPALTALENEVYRGDISSLSVSPDDPSVLVAECVLPASSGGYTIRGIGIYAGDTLYAVGNYPDQPKPAPDSGYAATLEILAQLAVSDTADVTLNVTDGAWLTKAQGDQLYVPLEREINGHPLTEDVTLTKGDIGLKNVGNFMAVQQGGGEGMGSNKVYLGWDDNKLILQVDDTKLGGLFYDKRPPTPAQVGAFPVSGGILSDGAYVGVISGDQNPSTGDFCYSPTFQTTIKGRGVNNVPEGATFYMHLVEHVGTLAYGELVFDGFDSWASFRFTQNGEIQSDGGIRSGGGGNFGANVNITWGGNGHTYQENGDIVQTSGNNSIFGSFSATNLSGALVNINSNAVNAQNTANDAWNKANDAQLNRVGDVALGARWTGVLPGGGGIESPAGGYVMTGWYTEGQNPGGDTLVFRPIQKYTSSQGWVNVGHTA